MKKLINVLVFLLAFLLWPGCASATAYGGPFGDRPLLSVSYMRHVVPALDPRFPEHVETLATADVTNPSTKPMRVTLDCTETLTTMTIAPRTTEHVLLDPADTSCTVSR